MAVRPGIAGLSPGNPATPKAAPSNLARAFKGDPKAVASLIGIMRQSGYGPDRDEPTVDVLSIVDQQAIIADFLTRNASSDEADPEIASANESSASAVSSTEEPSDDAN